MAIRPIASSTQEHLDIEDIRDDLVILKDGSCALVMQTTALNFGLLSEREQDATIYAYAALLNSLSFPLQILVVSKKKDISSYLDLLKKEEGKRKDSKLEDQIKKYRLFVEKTVKERKVLDKKFYLIIPFSALELGVVQTLGTKTRRKTGLPYPKDYITGRAKTSLFPKRDHLARQFNRLSLKTRQLNTQELIQLFHSLYNPTAEGVRIVSAKEYSTPIVETATK